ncbi:hypothetical protein [Dokdonella sp.]|uniref:bestrophin-like domain n=1 Tax=Dokdonella sp. TaxID=2291710 RepID=UPI003527A624
MLDLIFQQNSLLISAGIFAGMVLAVEFGYRLGRPVQGRESDTTRTHINAIQGSLLGFLALILGFTLSLSLQRYDMRSQAVVDEANAIGTTWLRAQLLPDSVRTQVQDRLRQHVDLRVRAGSIDLAHESDRDVLLGNTNQNLDAVWALALQAAVEKPEMVATGLFIQALNDMIDSYGRRDAALARHVPNEILFLLFATFVLTGGVVGYAAGVAGHRPSVTTYVLLVLIVVLSFVIMDLDRPRRGIIRIDQSSLVNLGAALDAGPGATDTHSRAVTGHP